MKHNNTDLIEPSCLLLFLQKLCLPFLGKHIYHVLLKLYFFQIHNIMLSTNPHIFLLVQGLSKKTSPSEPGFCSCRFPSEVTPFLSFFSQIHLKQNMCFLSKTCPRRQVLLSRVVFFLFPRSYVFLFLLTKFSIVCSLTRDPFRYL